jgi:hypothetical protein
VIAFYDDDFRDVGEAMALHVDKVKSLDAKRLLRVHDVLCVPGIVAINRELGFGRSARRPFLGRWVTTVHKWLAYRESNPQLLAGLVKTGLKETVKQLARRSGYKPASEKFYEMLRWKQAQAKDGRRSIAIGKALARAETWEGLTETEICERIVSKRLGYKVITGLLPAHLGLTRAIVAAAIEAGSLSDKDLVIATPTLEELGLLQVQDIRDRWQVAVRAAEDQDVGLVGVVVVDVRPRVRRQQADAVDRGGAREDVVRAVADVVLRDWRAAECDRDQEDDEDAARDRDLVAAEAAPDELPVASGLYLFDLAEVRAALDADGRAEAGAGVDENFILLLSHV